MAEPVKPKEGVSMMSEVSSKTREKGGESGQKPAGLYRHKESGEEIHLTVDPLLGDGQARAFERAGFEFIRDSKPGEVVYFQPSYLTQEDAKGTASAADLKGVQARQDQLEATNEKLSDALTQAIAALQAAGVQLPGVASTAPEAPEAPKTDASEMTAEVAQTVEVKKEDSRTKLEEVATALGMTDLDEHETKDKLVSAIKAKQAEKGNQ